MKQFICFVLALALLGASLLTLYPQLLGGDSTISAIDNLIPEDYSDYAPWKMGVQGLESFPMYGTYYEDRGFYGIKDVMEDASAFIKSGEADRPDIWGYLGKIPKNTGFLQALYALAILILVSIPVYIKPFGGHFRHASGHAVYEPAVVGHGEYSAFVVHKRVLKHLAGVHVQMVGGFVQYEQVVVPEHELAQRHPPALAAGQSAHLAEHILAREQEQPQRASDFTRLEQGRGIRR